jgi:hypothetical protein
MSCHRRVGRIRQADLRERRTRTQRRPRRSVDHREKTFDEDAFDLVAAKLGLDRAPEQIRTAPGHDDGQHGRVRV